MTIKRCSYCGLPFEPLADEENCPEHRHIGTYQAVFDDRREAENPFPDLPIVDSVSWRQRGFPERRFFLYPIIPEASITMVAGQKGCGKTMFCMSIVDAITKGENFLIWENRAGPIKCLYFDGEMHQNELRDRLNQMDTNSSFNLFSVSGNHAEANPFSGDLTNINYRDTITHCLLTDEIKLLVLDNVASLAPGANENIKSDWDPINQWLLSLRHQGITVILVHHLGKGGQQRGTSAREDNVDNIIYLKKPSGYTADMGARFNLIFDKFRGKVETGDGELIKNREMWYKENADGVYGWVECDAILENSKKIAVDLVESGLSLKKIGEKHGMSQSTITRRKKMLIEDGYIKADGRKLEYTDEGKDWLGL